MSWSTRTRAAAGLAAAVVLLSGCGSTQDERAQQVADEFYAAVEARDGRAACALLTRATQDELRQSAQKPCDEAILEEDVPVARQAEQVEVYDTMAQVRYAEDTVFLTRIDDSWRVYAASCTRRPGEQPYDCQVTGG